MKLNLQFFSLPIGHQGMGIKPDGHYTKSRSKAGSKARSSSNKKSNSSKSNSSNSSSSSNSPGNVSSAERQSWETGTGIAFMGQMSAQIVHDVMFKFILGDADLNNNYSKIDLMYRYNFGGQILSLRKLIDMDIPDDAGEWIKNTNNFDNIYNPDECMNSDPTEFLQFEGTLVDFINALSNQPFNEVFWTNEEQDDHQNEVGPYQEYAIEHNSADPYDDNTHQSILNDNIEDRIPHATLHYRQTPFEPNQWFQLPIMYINNKDIINAQISETDDEQYSVFNITNSQEFLPQIATLPPVTDDNEELQRKYGYKYMDITSEYFVNTKPQVDLSISDLVEAVSRQDEDTQTGNAADGYPSWTTFNDYFGPDSASQVEQNRDPELMSNLPMSDLRGGVTLYNDACRLLNRHLQGYIRDCVQYELMAMMVTYSEAQQDTQELESYDASSAAAAGTSAGSTPSISSPLQLPVGHTHEDFGQNPIYVQWQSDLAELRSLWQSGNISTTEGLDTDIQELLNEHANLTLSSNGTIISPEKHTITMQKAGQLAMSYMLSLAGASQAINGFLKNPGVVALNPWLGQVEQATSTKSSSKSSSSKSKSKSKSTSSKYGFGMQPWD